MGHIRDLPRNAADVPDEYRGESWARTGVDVDNDFRPLYVITPDRRQQVTGLRRLLKGMDEVLLATDEDREGEAIAWHLLEVLSPKVPVKRMVFHEITPQAIRQAIDNPRDIDRRLVDAQEARRILDRLYGYEVSPVLWRKVLPRLSAGRVQSVATRIVVEREWERMRFVSAGYWDVDGTFATAGGRDPRGSPGRPRRPAAGHRQGLRPRRPSGPGRPGRAGRGRRPGPGRRAHRPALRRRRGRVPALPALTGSAVHHLDAAAGGGAQAAAVLGADHAHGPEPLRAGLHHLHADRLDHAVRGGARAPPGPWWPSATAPSTCRRSPASTPRRSRTPRRRTRPSAPPATGSVRRRTSPGWSGPARPGSTT